MSNVISLSEARARHASGTLARGTYTVVDDPPGVAVLIPIPIPGYMQRKGQLGLAYLDTGTGTSWCYSHTGYYIGHWSFHTPKDEPDAYYGTSDGYVPQHVKEAAAPIIAAFPPLPKPSYDEDYV
jgi:hypothetical protein